MVLSLAGSRRSCAFVCFVLLSLAGTLSFGQQLPTASPESVGLSSERLQRITAAVDQSIKDQQIAGAVTIIVRHGKVAWLKSQGMLDREAAKPMPEDAMSASAP